MTHLRNVLGPSILVIAVVASSQIAFASDPFVCNTNCSPSISPPACYSDTIALQPRLSLSCPNDNLGRELDDWAAIEKDALAGGVCAGRAADRLAQRLRNLYSLPDQTVLDCTGGPQRHYFDQWLAGGLVTHIFVAAKQIDWLGIPVASDLPSLLQSTRTNYAGIGVTQDPGCGVPTNGCMDDHTLTASGFAWIAAFEYAKLRDASFWVSKAQNHITYALSPMSDPTAYGGGPCVFLIGSSPADCSATLTTYRQNPSAYRIVGANHSQENPNYGLGLMTSIASACAALYEAAHTCSFTSNQHLVAGQLWLTAQDRSTNDGCDFTTNCAAFDNLNPPTRACDDSDGLGISTSVAYKPKDYPLYHFYQQRGFTSAELQGAPGNNYQFSAYCDNRTTFPPAYDKLWGPNRQQFYSYLADAIFNGDYTAPRVGVASPQPGAVVTGPLTIASGPADNVLVSSVAYWLSGSGSPFCATTWPFQCYIDTSTGNVDSTYTMYARATDGAGNVSAPSGTVTFKVSNPRLNAGGVGFVDQYANHWFSDYGYNTGYTASTTANISGTDLPQLYQSVRWYPGVFTYTLPVANGVRHVKLRFAEFVYTTPGARYFNVLVNGTQVLTNFDVVAAAGGAFIAVDRNFVTNVANQQVTITFVPVHENPEISAIQVY